MHFGVFQNSWGFFFHFLIFLVFLLFFYLSLQGFYLDLNFLLGFQYVLITCSFFNFHLSKSKSHLDRVTPNYLYFYFSLRIDLFNGCYLLEIRWKFSFYTLFLKCFVSISVTFEWAGVFCWLSLRQCKCYYLSHLHCFTSIMFFIHLRKQFRKIFEQKYL